MLRRGRAAGESTSTVRGEVCFPAGDSTAATRGETCLPAGLTTTATRGVLEGVAGGGGGFITSETASLLAVAEPDAAAAAARWLVRRGRVLAGVEGLASGPLSEPVCSRRFTIVSQRLQQSESESVIREHARRRWNGGQNVIANAITSADADVIANVIADDLFLTGSPNLASA